MAHNDTLRGSTGLRLGEVRALRWEAVDQKRRRITVQEAVKNREIGCCAEVGEPEQDDSVNTIQIFDAFLKQMKQLPRRGGFMFSRDDGNLICSVYFVRQMDKTVKASGAEWRGTPAHTSRDFACSLFMQEFGNPKKVQQLLGHSGITVTIYIYTHL